MRTKNQQTGKLVRCKLHATCRKECGAKTPHPPTECEPCPFNDVAKCIEFGPQDVMLSEEGPADLASELTAKIPGPAAAR